MGLFDYFKKKTNQPPQPNPGRENKLETLLEKASKDPAYRKEFYQSLLDEKVVILTAKSHLQEGSQLLEQNTSINIVKLEDGKIPVFSTKARIFEKGIIKEEVQYLEMKGADLLNLASDASFVLNPYSDHYKVIVPGEIDGVLNGTVPGDGHKAIIIDRTTEVQIGQPSKYPEEIINSLKIIFSERAAVKFAYMAWVFDPVSGEPPHYIFGLDIEGEAQSIIHEAGAAARRHLRSRDIVDFIRIDGNAGLSKYLVTQTTPFYQR